ncbi:DNA polymerase III subunit gamma/tau [Candidatus Fermentibacteria bacterium]|nr:DNA polymerase III subunit gamma/tau [Candidatus Fermentibacteria bacterium]
MSYMVLARKWRPQTFGEMIGQEHVTRTLSNALRTGKISHAYLFHGPRGVGKTTAARILAKAVNCEREVTPEPCNACPTCVAINRGTSLDVVEMDGASNRGIDEIRELREHVGYAPVSARHKVYIIDEVHMLTEQAFNALLKTLEEPPAHAVFVFATTEVHKVPATILSRCQRFEFRRIPQASVVERLSFLAAQEGLSVEHAALALMARRAEGCLRDAESLLDQAGSACDGPIQEATVRQLLGLSPLEELTVLLEAVSRRDLGATARQLDRMISNGMEIERIAADLVDVILDVLRQKVGGAEPLEALHGVAPELTPADLLRMLSVLQSALQSARQSARPGPVMESAFFRLALMDRSVSVEEVLRALGEGASEPQAAEKERIAEPTLHPPPPAEAAAGDSPGAPDEVLTAAWRGLSASTKSFVMEATPSWRGDTVVLQFAPSQSFVSTRLEQGTRRAEVERVLSAAAGRPISVEIAGAQALPAVPPVPAAEDDPLVKEIVRRFDGMVVETRSSREEVAKR